jgi:hypothetical protein
MSLSDNARNDVLLHVSASSKRQKNENKRERIKYKTEGLIPRLNHVSG